jgi:hypothetical protein
MRDLRLKSEAFWTNAQDNVMLECTVLEGSQQSTVRRSRGSCFVSASPAVWSSTISNRIAQLHAFRGIETNKGGQVWVGLHLSSPSPATNPAQLLSGGFAIYPADIGNALPEPSTPPFDGWGERPHTEKLPYLPVAYGDDLVHVWATVVPSPSTAKVKKWWWYPAQALLLPALAVDIVTFPVQLMLTMHAFNRIPE